MKKLPLSFYRRTNVVNIAKELLGKIIETNTDGLITSARIVETEAYAGYTDKASHAYKGRRTARNEHMYAHGGTVYVYICYGMHHMLNVVTNDKDVPDAVLVRAAEPITGIDIMLKRTGKTVFDNSITRGPGNLAKALGITKIDSGIEFGTENISLFNDGMKLQEEEIGVSKRIGIDSAGNDALLPYRFYVRGNRFVSGRPVR